MNSIKKFASQLVVEMLSLFICIGLGIWMVLPHRYAPEPAYENVRVKQF